MNNGVLVLCDDLIFASKVMATGRALNIPAAMSRTPEKALAKCAESMPACLIVDLNYPGLNLAEFLESLRDQAGKPILVGFGSHVQADVLKEARKLGFDHVMPRSQFHECLESELPKWV